MPASSLTTPAGKPGLLAEYRSGENFDPKAPVIVSRVETAIDLRESSVPEALRGKAFNVRWTGQLNAPESGDYRIGFKANSNAGAEVEGRPVARTYGGISLGRIHATRGTPLKITASYSSANGQPEAQLIWHRINDEVAPAALDAVSNSDVAVVVVGITSALEGEEMPVSEPGFQGGDRTSIDLPEPEQALVRAVASTGKPFVVVLMNGSALATRWEKEHANAILESWYAGQEGGTAIAQTLSGLNNPAGRLPVTFYRDTQQLPHFEDYAMKGRTYRYFTGEPLWPFGYGLSYTKFRYSDLSAPAQISAGRPLHASVTVTNVGPIAGDEVVQVYLGFSKQTGAPLRALRGFKRIHLAPGETRTVPFDLSARDLSMVTDKGDIVVAPGTYQLSIGGGQPGSGLPFATAEVGISGRAQLPE